MKSEGDLTDTAVSELDKLAAQEILKETSQAVDGWENRGNGVPSNIQIPLFMQNRVPSGFETDEKVDVALRADQVKQRKHLYLCI